MATTWDQSPKLVRQILAGTMVMSLLMITIEFLQHTTALSDLVEDALHFLIVTGLLVHIALSSWSDFPSRSSRNALLVAFALLFGMLTLDLTEEIPSLVDTPVLGDHSLLNNLVQDLCLVGSIGLLVLCLYLVIESLAQKAIEEEQLHEATRAAEARYRSIFENSPHGIFRATSDGQLLHANPAMAKILGYKNPEALRNSLPVNLVERHALETATAKSRAESESGGNECQFRRLDGSEGWAALTVRDLNGAQAIEGTLVDVTDRRELEEQLRQAEKMEALGTLSGGIAHDINNILVPIRVYSETALHLASDQRELAGALEEILKATDRAGGLADQILTFSRQVPHGLKVFDLSETIRDAVPLLRASLPTTTQIQTSTSNEPCNIEADPTEISQIALNLSANAAYAMNERRGLLQISVRKISSEQLNPKSCMFCYAELPVEEWAELTFEDSGCGITPEHQRRVFDPFYTTKPVGEGTGLGLAVVHRIVKGSHGALKIASERNVGTRVSVYFPIVEEAVNGLSTNGSANGTQRGLRILIVDDEPAVVLALKFMLRHLGHEVIAASSADEAWKLLEAGIERFNLLVTDQTMPGMTGLELIEKVHGVSSSFPVLLLSGFGSSEIELSANNDEYRFLRKPFSLSDMESALSHLSIRGNDRLSHCD